MLAGTFLPKDTKLEIGFYNNSTSKSRLWVWSCFLNEQLMWYSTKIFCYGRFSKTTGGIVIQDHWSQSWFLSEHVNNTEIVHSCFHSCHLRSPQVVAPLHNLHLLPNVHMQEPPLSQITRQSLEG